MTTKRRKGQSEVIGGIIVLTLLFMFAIPMIMNVYNAVITSNEETKTSLTEARSSFNEKLSIGPVNPDDPQAQRRGWIPGVWINNTGTVAVTLDKLYLVDTINNTVYLVYDFRYMRPGVSLYVKDMLLNVEETTATSQQLPPIGQRITLKPGDTLLIVFEEILLGDAPHLVALVESVNGIIHPLAGGNAKTIYPGRPKTQPFLGNWRGIFAPQSGFMLKGDQEIRKKTLIWGERPGSWVDEVFYYISSWQIDNDYKHPPYYRINLTDRWGYEYSFNGFLGTFEGYSTVLVKGWYMSSDYDKIVYTDSVDLERFVGTADMDRNGVNETVFYTYWIDYYQGVHEYDNPDADGDGSRWSDSLAVMIQSARDLSNIDYVKISVKIIYDLAIYGDEEPTMPLKVFSLAVWKYDENLREWVIYTTKDYSFVNMGPKTFVVSATFPLNRSDTYRVGVILYDPYTSLDSTYYEFMMGVEHIIVEYGVLNPLFQESPPMYIVAIPDPDLIRDIGAADYMNLTNITDVNEAKVAAQQELLSKLVDELNYAGVSGYTIIRSPQMLCDLLFSSQPPRYGIVVWLQGNITIEEVASMSCSITSSDVYNLINNNHLVLVWAFSKPFGDIGSIQAYNSYISLSDKGEYLANITDAGVAARKKAYAYYLLNNVLFEYNVTIDKDYDDTYTIHNATFYLISTSDTSIGYGTYAFWTESLGGAIVVNPVHIDWDFTGDGALPDTVVQQVVYSALISWAIVTTTR